MKKITILAVAALAISFASCKKDRTCTCTDSTTTTVTTSSGSTTTTSNGGDSRTFSKVSKKAGRVYCLSKKSSNEQTISGTTYKQETTETCTLS